MFYTVEGVNTAPEQTYREYDHHCPMLPGRLNMHKSDCLSKQRQTESQQPYCSGGCKAHKQPKQPQTQNNKMSQGARRKMETLQVIEMFEGGKSNLDIAVILNRKVTTVKKWRVKFEKGCLT